MSLAERITTIIAFTLFCAVIFYLGMSSQRNLVSKELPPPTHLVTYYDASLDSIITVECSNFHFSRFHKTLKISIKNKGEIIILTKYFLKLETWNKRD